MRLTREDRRVVREVAEVFCDPITGLPAKVVSVRFMAANAAEREGSEMAGLECIGKLWKPREGSKALATGSVTLDGKTVRVGVFKIEKRHAKEGAKDSDSVVLLLRDRP